jgi:hypothetical protein
LIPVRAVFALFWSEIIFHSKFPSTKPFNCYSSTKRVARNLQIYFIYQDWPETGYDFLRTGAEFLQAIKFERDILWDAHGDADAATDALNDVVKIVDGLSNGLKHKENGYEPSPCKEQNMCYFAKYFSIWE